MALLLFGLRPNGRDRHTHVPHVTIESRVFHFKISMDAVRALSPCVTRCDDKSIKPAFGIVIRSGAVWTYSVCSIKTVYYECGQFTPAALHHALNLAERLSMEVQCRLSRQP